MNFLLIVIDQENTMIRERRHHDKPLCRFRYHNPEVDFSDRRPVNEVEDLKTPDLRRLIQSRRHRAEQQRWKEPLPNRPVSPLNSAVTVKLNSAFFVSLWSLDGKESKTRRYLKAANESHSTASSATLKHTASVRPSQVCV